MSFKPTVIVQFPEQLNQIERKHIKQQLERESENGINAIVLPGGVTAVFSTPYVFEESCEGCTWKAGVQTMEDLKQISDWCCGLAEQFRTKHKVGDGR